MNRQQRIQWLARVFAGSVFLTAGAAWGVVYTWNGGTGNWDDQSKWTPGTAYPVAVDTAVINSGTGTITLNGNQASTSLLFDTNAGNYTLGNNTLFLGAGGLTVAHNSAISKTYTINSNLALTADATFSNAQGFGGNRPQTITINGNTDTAGHTLTIANGFASSFTFNGGITGAGDVFIVPNVDYGTVNFNGNNSFNGNLLVTGSIPNGNNLVVKGSSGVLSGTKDISVIAGASFSLGDTGSSVADAGLVGSGTQGRILNDALLRVYGGNLLVQGQNSVATSEYLGELRIGDGLDTVRVTNGSSSTALLQASTLVRNPANRALLYVSSGNNNLASSSLVKFGDAGASITQIGGLNTRGTDKKIIPYVVTRTASTANSTPNSFARYDATNGITPLDPASDFINATSTDFTNQVFPTVNADGNDNVRIPYAPIAGESSFTHIMNVPSGDTAVNSLLIDDNAAGTIGGPYLQIDIRGPTGSSLTVKSGALLLTGTGSDQQPAVQFSVPTINFGAGGTGVEGVISYFGYGNVGRWFVNSNLVGDRGLTVTQSNSGGANTSINGDNSGLTGLITIAGNTVDVSNVNGLGNSAANSNTVYIAQGTSLRPTAAISSGISLTVAGLAGFGTVDRNQNLNIGGNGTGGASNTVTMLAGGAISPGTSGLAGTLTLNNFGTVALKDGTLALDLLGASSYDALSLTTGDPALTLSGGGNPGATLDLNLDYAASIGDLFLIAKVGGATAISGTFSNGVSLMTTYGGPNFEYNFDILYNSNLAGGDGNDIVLRLARIVIPEPASGIILSFALGALVLGRRRFS